MRYFSEICGPYRLFQAIVGPVVFSMVVGKKFACSLKLKRG
jgi:hypothetical protein